MRSLLLTMISLPALAQLVPARSFYDLPSSNVGTRSINAWHRLGLALGGPVQRSLTQSGRLRAATLRKIGGT